MNRSDNQDDLASCIDIVDNLIDQFSGEERGLIELLQKVGEEFNYLPRPALERISERLDVPLSRIYSIATFYHDFKLEPQGEHRFQVCSGTACHVKGSGGIVDILCRDLGLQPGDTTEDGKLTFETVNCVGLCGVGPIGILDGEYYNQLTAEKALELVNNL